MEKRVLAVDFGERRLGIALSDPANILASPYCTLDTRKDGDPVESIARIAFQESVGLVLVGIPLDADGGMGEKAKVVEAFTGRLAEALPGLKIEKADERYTTAEAKGFLMQRKRKKRTDKKIIDRMAAAVLLQDYLDERKGGPR